MIDEFGRVITYVDAWLNSVNFKSLLAMLSCNLHNAPEQSCRGTALEL